MEPVSITGIGSYLPRLSHTNETLPALDKPLTPQEIERIGVYRRHWAGDDEGIAEMAAEAAKRALTRSDTEPRALDLIVLANWTQRRFIPEFAPKLQRLLGASGAVAFDVSCACAGFIHGVAIASSFLQTPRFSRALVVASETTSRRGRPGSKASLIFGDGAGAFVLEKRATKGGVLIDFELATHGEHHDIMDVSDDGFVHTHLAQQELNQLAARSFVEVSSRLLHRAGRSMADVDWIVPHSGTAGVQAAVTRALEVEPSRVLTNFARVGNVSSAAIPVALDEFVSEGRLRPGEVVLSPAVGTGWYAAAMLFSL